MNIGEPTATEEMLALPCDHCGAMPGEWCFTVTGKRSGYLHSARFYVERAGPVNDEDDTRTAQERVEDSAFEARIRKLTRARKWQELRALLVIYGSALDEREWDVTPDVNP